MSKDTLRNRLRDLVALGGLRKVTPHDLRRTYATELLEAGVHPLVVQALLGHSCLQTTTRYAQVRPERHAELHEALSKLLSTKR